MKELLAEVAGVPGVRSSFVFNVKNNLLVRGQNLAVADEAIQTIGVHFIRLMRLSYMVGLDLQVMRFYFNELLVLGIPLEEDVVLAVCCEEKVDINVLLAVAGREVSFANVEPIEFASQVVPGTAGEGYLQDDQARGAGIEQIEYGETITMMPDDEQGAEYEQDPEEDERMQEYYDEIKKALALTIGPLAEFVFRDSMSLWRLNGPPIQARLFELITIMAEEIGDLQLADDFISRLRRFF